MPSSMALFISYKFSFATASFFHNTPKHHMIELLAAVKNTRKL